MAKKLWGGRFKKEMHPRLKCFSYSLAVDFELLEAELFLDEAWAKMLGRVGLITQAEARRLVQAIKAIGKELISKDPHQRISRNLVMKYEDVHTLIQDQLEKRIGGLARKIHTGRSRNDLVVTSTRIYLRAKLDRIGLEIAACQQSLVALAKKAGGIMIPGMTHLKKAQPILLAHHLLAYVEMLEEDHDRLRDARKRIDVLGLGSAALAGSGLRLDQKFLAKELGFLKIAANSLAAVSDRAFLTEFLGAVAILWMHLSRLAEDFILWNSEYFGFIEIDDAFATGSSLMPQKKNPDVFELVRGRAGVIFGHFQALLTLQKGLPLAYNRDLQEDKTALFDAIGKTSLALDILALTLAAIAFKKHAIEKSLEDDNLYATDVLEYLVHRGISFSDAHEVAGKVVRYACDNDKGMRELKLREWKQFSPLFDAAIYELFNPSQSVHAKKTIGSTRPAFVRREITKWEQRLKRG